MQIKRNATARWEGTGKAGKGTLTTQSGLLKDAPYSFVTRFENAEGTNPEELLGAAHAGCFSMKLAFTLQAANITPDSIETRAEVILENGAISLVVLHTQVKAAGLTDEQFQAMATDAKQNCPVSKLFNCPVDLYATLHV